MLAFAVRGKRSGLKLRTQRRTVRVAGFVCSALERRLLLDASEYEVTDPYGTAIFDPAPDELIFQPLAASTAGIAEAGVPLDGIPQLSSRPQATARIFLDFDGEAAQTWGAYSVTTTPAYDTDGDATTFSSGELSNIQQIWARVAEKYSPFNIDVTTINPGSFANKVALKVVIGGAGAWLGASAGGVAYVGSFYNTSPNTAWIFEDNLANGNAKYTAEAAAHEAGHTFGLQHQSYYDASGNKTEYYQGDGQRAPIMGVSYYATRGLWWYGTSTSSTTFQDDLSILSNTSNGFGYRADDHGSTSATATDLVLNGSTFSITGVIERMTDSDWFSFYTDAGPVSITAAVAASGPMLDLKLELYDSTGGLISSASTSSLGESLGLAVAAGTYRVAVLGTGGQGDIGQYTLSGTITRSPNFIAAPTGLSAAVASASQVNLFWTDQSSNETGFAIKRSEDGGATFVEIGRVAANVTSFQDALIQAGVTYAYRVCAYSDVSASDDSNIVTVTPVPAAPQNLAATAASSTQINLAWQDVIGETGYRIERSADGLSGWSSIASVSANLTSFQNTGLAAGSTWFYRIIAIGAGGDSPASNTASATTSLGSAPTAPSGLAVAARIPNQLDLRWTDNSSNETAFAIEQSTDGATFTEIATVNANVMTFAVTGLSESTTYWFRIRAHNSAGYSSYTTAVSARPNPEPTGFAYSTFTASTPLTRTGSATVTSNVLRLTTKKNQTSSAFASTAQNIRRFTSSFDFLIGHASAEGLTFTIQGIGPSAIGTGGSGLGYGGTGSSLAVKFDHRSNAGEGTSSTGLYTNGATPTVPATNLLAAGIDLQQTTHVFRAEIAYDGAVLQVRITDTATSATALQSYSVDIPALVGAGYAWVGFTASTASASGNPNICQDIRNWSFAIMSAPPTVAIAPVTPALRNAPVSSITITFNEAVTGFDLSDLSLTRDGGANLLGSAQTLTTSNNITWTLNNLSAITALEGGYELSLIAGGSGITNGTGAALRDDAFADFQVDTTAPTVSIDPVAPSPRQTPVDAVILRFDEPVSGLLPSALRLTRNGGPNLLGPDQSLTSIDNVNWTLAGLETLTADAGLYELTLDPADAGITDMAGNSIAAGASITFTVELTIRLEGSTDWTIRLDATGSIVEFANGTTSFTHEAGTFSAVEVIGTAGDDQLTIDLANGGPLPADGLSFAGGTGVNALRMIAGPAGADLTLAPGQATFGTSLITWNGLGRFTLQGGDGDDALTIAAALPFAYAFNGGGGQDRILYADGSHALSPDDLAGTQSLALAATGSASVTLNGSLSLDSLVLEGDARIALAPGGAAALRTAGLCITGQAALDLADNDLIIPSSADSCTLLLQQVSGLLAAGRNGGRWDGPGIRSSSAQANPLTSPRALLNDNGLAQTIIAESGGEILDTHSVVVKYSWVGDLNLDGRIDGTDYFHLDLQFLTGSSGASLLSVDLDYNSHIDGDDYFLIDLAYLGQTSVLPASVSPTEGFPTRPSTIKSSDAPSSDSQAGPLLPVPPSPLAHADSEMAIAEPADSVARQVLSDETDILA